MKSFALAAVVCVGLLVTGSSARAQHRSRLHAPHQSHPQHFGPVYAHPPVRPGGFSFGTSNAPRVPTYTGVNGFGVAAPLGGTGIIITSASFPPYTSQASPGVLIGGRR